MKSLLVSSIRLYQQFFSFDKGVLALFAPGGACKFSPTCSEYTKQMIERDGIWQGLKLGMQRLWRCR